MVIEAPQPVETAEKNIRYPLIGVVGPMGSGKSTLTDLMVKMLDVPKYPFARHEEHYEDNPFLSDFYKDPRAFSFRSQVFFLTSKVDQLKDIKGSLSTQSVIIDPSLEMDMVFAQTQLKMGWMDEEEFKMYTDLFNILQTQNQIPKPDMFVVVNAPPKIIKERINQRGREYELQMLEKCPQYFDELCCQVDRFGRTAGNPVIRINSGKMDFVNTPHGRWEAVKEILDWSGYYFHHNNNHASDGSELIIPNFLK